MKALQIRVENEVKAASHSKRQNKQTCFYCKNSVKIDIAGQKELRCELIGTGINRKYRISPKDTCNKHEGSVAAFEL